jgi:hypothetical protein
MTTVGLRDTSTYTTVELVSCLVTPPARAYGSKGRLAARRQPTDQYDGALDITGDHIGAAQWHWPTSPGTSNQRSGRRGRGFESRHPDSRCCSSEPLTRLPGRGFAPFQSAAGAINALDHAKELKQYDVKSRDIRENGGIFKGYLADDLSDPWGRYLTDEQPTPDSGATSAT